jgi:prefoldin subunit 5
VKERLQQRLLELRAEHDQGRKMLAELEAKATSVQSTLLRITGAIQVLEELIGQDDSSLPRSGESPIGEVIAGVAPAA